MSYGLKLERNKKDYNSFFSSLVNDNINYFMNGMCQKAFEYFLFTLGGLATDYVYTTIAPVFPLEIERRHLSSFYSGLIFW